MQFNRFVNLCMYLEMFTFRLSNEFRDISRGLWAMVFIFCFAHLLVWCVMLMLTEQPTLTIDIVPKT